MKAASATTAIATLLVACAALPAATAQAQTHLGSTRDVAGPCALSSRERPDRPEVARASPTKPGAQIAADAPPAPARPLQSHADWAARRSDALLTVYSVDVTPAHFTLKTTEAPGLRVSAEGPLPLPGGRGRLALPALKGLPLEADAETIARAREAREAGALRLRLYVVFEALHHPERPLCTTDAGGALTLHARPLAARLWRASGKAAAPAALTPGDVLAEHSLPADRATAAMYGLGAIASGGPRPRVGVRWADEREAGGPQVERAVAEDLEHLALPCYLEALAAGGPQTAALTLELALGPNQDPKPAVSVDATGFPPLGRCVVEAARKLEAPSRTPRRLRLSLYFERGAGPRP